MNEVRIPRKIEAALLIAIVLIAIIFRLAAFAQVPPGLHYDEAIDAKLAQEIRSGVWPIYFEEGWGREPLYHYLVAFTLNLTPDPTTALRLTSGILGLIQLLAAYALFRSLFGIPTALIGAAWIAVLFWTVSTSRAGLRNITLTTLTTVTAWVFWRVCADARSKKQDARGKRQEARSKRQEARNTMQDEAGVLFLHPASCILPGILLGFTLYTYQPSRVVPLIYLVFVGFLAVRQREWSRHSWRGLTVFFGVAAIVAMPLIAFLLSHPNAETGRAFQTEPIRALLAGNLQPVLDTAVATLKMFTFEGGGDPQILYNISGRPIFSGLGSILFYLGLIVCVWRWKRAEYAFVLIWLIVALLPNLVTAPAPFFYRAIAAQTPVALLPAIGVAFVANLFKRQGAQGAKAPSKAATGILVLIAVLSLGQAALSTWRDYFDVWGNDPDMRFQYSAALTGIARTLDAAPDATPVSISAYFIEDADPLIFDQTLNRRDLQVRWFDARDSIGVAAEATTQRLALPSFTPLEPLLQTEFLPGAEPIAWTKDFKLYALDAAQFRNKIEGWSCGVCPVTFNGDVTLMGLKTSIADKTLVVQSAWRVQRDGRPSSTAIFIHLIGADGRPVAQDDRLGVPPHTWRAGDEFVQVHRISIADLRPGVYTLELGLYDRGDNRRWGAVDQSGRAMGDHVLLDEIEVTP